MNCRADGPTAVPSTQIIGSHQTASGGIGQARGASSRWICSEAVAEEPQQRILTTRCIHNGNPQMIRRVSTIVMVGILMIVACWPASAAEPLRTPDVDSAMESDPPLTIPPPRVVFSKQLRPLWLKALAGPEADLQREVAEMIARAHHLGMPGLTESVDPLISVLLEEEQRSNVRLAIARTLVVLGERKAAEPLFGLLNKEGLGFSQIVEPALAAWDYKPIREPWMKRLGNDETRDGLLRLAIRGLGRVREPEATEPLWELVRNRKTRLSFRLDAASALAGIQTSGLTDRARTFAGDKTSLGLADRLIAARLLSHHSDRSSQELLQELAVDRQPAVAAIALKRLLEIDFALVLPLVPELLKSPDANVRMLAAKSLALEPAPSSVERLGSLLNDPHPDIRRFACRTLFSYGSNGELNDAVRETATRLLGQKDWRGQEQAALLVGALDYKPAAARLVELLDAPRDEPQAAAAWALRKLNIASTFPPMLECAERVIEKRVAESDGNNNERLVQLMQAFGQRQYKPATDIIWRLIPKTFRFSLRERVAAIWALGHIVTGDKKSELSKLLIERLSDVESLPPEDNSVRTMSAVSLGRIEAADAVTSLRKFYEYDSPQTNVGFACRWSIQKITGERLPGPKPRTIGSGPWKLAPLSPPVSR